MKEIKLRIDGYEDRTRIVGILADNGYKVKIEASTGGYVWDKKYFVVVELK